MKALMLYAEALAAYAQSKRDEAYELYSQFNGYCERNEAQINDLEYEAGCADRQTLVLRMAGRAA
jgi:hypothetical protein